MLNFIKEYWLQTIFGGVTTCLTLTIKGLYSRIKAERLEQDLIKEGVIAILHDRLYHVCHEYISNGYITVPDLNNLGYLYYGYHNLGGNGTGTELYERCKKLPLK